MIDEGTPIGTVLPPLPPLTQAAFAAGSMVAGRAFVMFKDARDITFSGSGVLVEHKGHVVLCTAGHVVEYTRAHADDVLLVFTGQPAPARLMSLAGQQGMMSKGGWAPHEHYPRDNPDRLDLGFIVLDPARMASVSGWEPIPFERLHDVDGPSDWSLLLCGGPAEGQELVEVKTVERGREQIEVKTVECDLSFVLGNFRAVTGRPPLHDVRPELLQIEWTKTGHPAGGKLTKAGRPQGMSGGPVFLYLDGGPGGIWSPTKHLALIGIIIFERAADGVLLAEPIGKLRDYIRASVDTQNRPMMDT